MRRGASWLGVVLVLCLQGPASAKSLDLTRAELSGPGINGPVVLDRADLGGISEAGSPLAVALARLQAPKRAAPDVSDFGPQYRLTFILEAGLAPDTRSQRVATRFYPYAADGPLFYVPPGQGFEVDGRPAAGWERLPSPLLARLRDHGLPPEAWARRTGEPPPLSSWLPILLALSALAIFLSHAGSRSSMHVPGRAAR